LDDSVVLDERRYTLTRLTRSIQRGLPVLSLAVPVAPSSGLWAHLYYSEADRLTGLAK
jgi:hypothetical protein